MNQRSVLLVDDDEEYLRLLETILKQEGVETYLAANGKKPWNF